MSIWNIVEYKPKVPQAQGNLRSAYIYEKDRKLPDLQAGFRIFGSDQDPNPANSFLYVENPVRLPQIDPFAWGPQYESILQVKEDHNQGFRATLDIPDLRRIPVSVNGVPLEGFQPPPQQEVQAETRTNHASGAGEAHKVTVDQKNNRKKSDVSVKREGDKNDEKKEPEQAPVKLEEEKKQPGLLAWLKNKLFGGKISEPVKEEFYNELNNMVEGIVQNQFKDIATKADVDRIISELSPLIKSVGDATIKVEEAVESKDESEVGGLMNSVGKDIKRLEQRGFIITEEDIGLKNQLIQGIAELNIAAKSQDKNSINSVIEKLYDMIKGKEGDQFDEIRMDLLNVRINLVKRGLSNVNSTGDVEDVKEEFQSLRRLFIELGNIVVKEKSYGPQLDTIQEELEKIQSNVYSGRIAIVRSELSKHDVLNAIDKLREDLTKKVEARSPRSGAQAVIGENILNPDIIKELKESLLKLNVKVKATSENFTNLGRALERQLNTIADQYGKQAEEKLDNVIEALKKQEMQILQKNQNVLELYLQKFNQLLPNPNSENPQARSILESQLKELREEMRVQFSALGALIGRLEGRMQGQPEISSQIVEQMNRVPYNSQELPVLLDVIMNEQSQNPSQALIDEQTVFIENLLKQFFLYLQELGNRRADETVINNIFNTMNFSLFLPSNPAIKNLIQNVQENLASKGVDGTEDRFQDMDLSSDITRRKAAFISTDESQSNVEQNVRKRAKSSPTGNQIVEPQASKPYVIDPRLSELQEISKRKNMFSQNLTFEELAKMVPNPSSLPLPSVFIPPTPQNFPRIIISPEESPRFSNAETPTAEWAVDYIDNKEMEDLNFDLAQQEQETSALPPRSGRRFSETAKANELERLQRLGKKNAFKEYIVPRMNYVTFAKELVRSRFPTEFQLIETDKKASNLLVNELLRNIDKSIMSVSALTRNIAGRQGNELQKKVLKVLRAMERRQ